jgi:hypothetical protein
MTTSLTAMRVFHKPIIYITLEVIGYDSLKVVTRNLVMPCYRV